ncbi:LexA family transcriptional repressor [Izhakiella australiensis]|uniref:LexA family transcriptional repressor n=1 Tax=Izhakiella australiensis TaxID=1926881 RepID=A0A1S8YGG9_9GAMM|nr:LexA family transcriptional regulator [Izhakiella australiensis]OON38065.1 LexA family transcriptional repressor [Izhakiella australiensis]
MHPSEDIAARIRQLREAQGLSQRALAERCGWSAQSRIGNYESRLRNVSVEDAEILANALGVSTAWLLLGEDFAGTYRPGDRYPLLSWVSAGIWSEAIEPYSLQDVDEWYESETKVLGPAFWLRVEGDSMTAPSGLSIPEGTLVLVDTGRQAVNGSLVIAKLIDANEATFKKLIIDGGIKYLKGLNPTWPMKELDANCRIIGVAVQTMMKLV